MPGKHIRVLVNPTAGNGRAMAQLRALQQGPLPDTAIEWVECHSPAELTAQVRAAQALRLDVLALAGGDGTVALALNALETLNAVPLGILPLGTNNDFACQLGIPSALAEAQQLLAVGRSRRVDVARAVWPGRGGGRRFASAAAAGPAEEALRRSRAPGWPRIHALAGLRVLWGSRPRAVRVTWPEGRFDGLALCVAITNTRGYVGYPVSPQARVNDGLLDLYLVQRTSRLRLLSHLPRLLRGTHGSLPEVLLVQSNWFRLEGVGEELPLSFDGEPAAATTPVELQCEPAAVQMLLPQVQAEAAVPELAPQALPAFQAGV